MSAFSNFLIIFCISLKCDSVTLPHPLQIKNCVPLCKWLDSHNEYALRLSILCMNYIFPKFDGSVSCWWFWIFD